MTRISIVFLVVLSLYGNAQLHTEQGDRYFNQNLFSEAITCYQKDLGSKKKKVAEKAMQKLADCYRITGEFELAEEMYKKVLRRRKKDPVNYLNYALALKSSSKYAEAIVQFSEYKKLNPADPMSDIYISSCDSAQNWLVETIGKEVNGLSFNTEMQDFSPVIVCDSLLFFCSSRKESKEAFLSFNGGSRQNRLDLYSVNLNQANPAGQNQGAIKPVNLDALNTPLHEGPATFSKDGKQVYFTRTVKGRKKEGRILSTLQVFYSSCDSNGRWTEPVNAFSFSDPDYSYAHPSLSSDGQTIFFASDKPGGYGKTDIYFSTRQADGSWGKPVNAGNAVNTFGHELFPYISAAQVLYFSSNAHPGMGQLDIFKAVYKDNSWGQVENLKPPVNSIANDFGICVQKNRMQGFFSSDRFNGRGAEDIYSFSEEIPLEFGLAHNTLVFMDHSIYDGIKYRLYDLSDSTEQALIPVNGRYRLEMKALHKYRLSCKKNGMPYNELFFSYAAPDSVNTLHISSSASSFIIRNALASTVEPFEENTTPESFLSIADKSRDSASINVGLTHLPPAVAKPRTGYLIRQGFQTPPATIDSVGRQSLLVLSIGSANGVVAGASLSIFKNKQLTARLVADQAGLIRHQLDLDKGATYTLVISSEGYFDRELTLPVNDLYGLVDLKIAMLALGN